MRRGGYGAGGMCFDPAQVPTDLKEPSMEAGQSPARAASGWICPRCHAVWAPHVDRCTCEPATDAGDRTEITEGGFEPTSATMRRAGITPQDVLDASGPARR